MSYALNSPLKLRTSTSLQEQRSNVVRIDCLMLQCMHIIYVL